MHGAVFPDDRSWLRLTAQASVSLVLLLSTAALFGRLIDFPHAASFGAGNIPMAPLTSICFVALGTALLLATRPARPVALWLGALGAALVALCGLVVLLSGFGSDASVPAAFPVAATADFYAHALSLMSPATGALFALTGVALAGILVTRARGANPAAWALVATAVGGLVSVAATFIGISYATAVPLFYDGSTLPMALPTAMAFALLGCGLLAMAAYCAPRPISWRGRLADVSIAMQLRLGLGGIVLAVAGLGYVVHLQSNVLWAQTRGMYEHPLVVTRTASELKAYAWRIHGVLGDLASAPAERDVPRLAREMVESHFAVGDTMAILARAYLGPPDDIATLHEELTGWLAMCVSLLDSSDAQSNDDFSRVASAGAAAAMRVLERIQVITNFAQGTADRQYAEAERRNSALEAAVIAMFGTVLLGASVVGGLLTRQISHRVLELTSVAAQFAQGKLDVRSTSGSANELGALANTFNAMADTIQANLESTAQLTEQLRRSEASLSVQNKELEAFSYSVSHDLRTPLRSIDGFSRILLEDYDASLDEEGRDCLKRIRTAAEYMAQLIDDLLRLSRLSRGGLSYERVDLSAMVHEIAAEWGRQNPERHVNWVVAEGVVAHGDRRLLRVVLTNLLGNALKFTSTRIDARIEFGTIAQDGRLRYFVRDNGVGFDPKYADKLFGAFQRLHGKNEFPGTGIRLATVQRVIHRHGGSVWAEGAVDQGATFSFDLGMQVIES